MLNALIRWSLQNRWVVLLAALIVTIAGIVQMRSMPVDVFPDLNRPTVTILTEARGLAPEEVETLVTRPLEYLLNGATGVKRVRSSSGIGLSVVWVEFDWGTDIYQDRQIVAEKIQLARERLPPETNPTLAPISSIMGEIMLLAVRLKEPPEDTKERDQRMMELRTLSEFTIRNRLLSVEGVSQVTVMGGILKQYQILTTPARLAAGKVTLAELTKAAEDANVIAGGGVLNTQTREVLIRIQGQTLSLEELGETPIVWRGNRAVRIKDVADVVIAGPTRRGDGGVRLRDGNDIRGGSAVILTVQKQPGANTLALDPKITAALDQLQKQLPNDVVIETRVFRQADFIRSAIDNVTEGIRDGTIWVVVILLVFLASIRTSLITLTALPLSLLVTLLIFHAFGITINTMTLGGLAVAIGELVDDAIVDVENIHRRLRENRLLPTPLPTMQVIADASGEVRNSIVYATLIVCLVVLPLFAMSGLEGRMFAPLGMAYVLSLLASLIVSLTVTPALASLLLRHSSHSHQAREPLMLRGLKWLAAKVVRRSMRHTRLIFVSVILVAVVSNVMLLGMGSEFLPPFNEGTMTVAVQLEPGTSLHESTRIAERAEALILTVPEVQAVTRRTGRAEMDEHAEGVNSSELEVLIQPHEVRKPGVWSAVLRAIPGLHTFGVTKQGRSHAAVEADIREKVTALPNIKVNVGQPISHRLDHMMSGVRAQLAVKVFGNDLRELRTSAQDVQTRLSQIPGVVDLQLEPQVEIPQLRLQVKRSEAARYGLSPGEVARLLETAYKGRVVALVLDEDRFYQLVVWFEESARNDPTLIGQTILDTPSGKKVALFQVADVLSTTGPNTLNHEAVERRIVVAANVQGRDLGSVVADIERALEPVQAILRAKGSTDRIEIGGQFEAQQAAAVRLRLLGVAAVLGVFLLLWKCLASWRAAALVLFINLPLGVFGAVVALVLTHLPAWETLAETPWYRWPQVMAAGITLSIAHWVGFITLIGIVSRNGIMMLSHYLHLMQHEGEAFTQEMIVRGSLERLAPVLMTAFTAIMGLIPLALGAGQTGKEILHPLAIVVIGGLLNATIMDQIVTPALFWRYGRKIAPVAPTQA